MGISWLNTLMSVSEFGVVTGVVLEGTEYIPAIHRKWPWLERVGFLVLVIALIGDRHFQSAINKQQSQDLIAARDRIVALSPRGWLLTPDVNNQVIAELKPFAGQRVDFVIWRQGANSANTTEQSFFISRLWDNVLGFAGWVDWTGRSLASNEAFRADQHARPAWPGAVSALVISSENSLPRSVMIKIEKQRASTRTYDAAVALQQALGKNIPSMPVALDLNLTDSPYHGNQGLPARDDPNTIVIFVGMKDAISPPSVD